MANPSKRYPWAVEMKIADRWYPTAGYRDKDEAEAQAELVRKRTEESEVRVTRFADDR